MLKDKIRVTVEPCKIGTRGGLQVFFLLLHSIADKEPHCYDSLIWINLLEPPFYCLIEVDVVWGCWIKLKSQLFLYSSQKVSKFRDVWTEEVLLYYINYSSLLCKGFIEGSGGSVGSSFDSLSVDACQSWVWAPSKAPVVSLSMKLYPHCLVLVGSGTDSSIIYIC